MKIFRVNKIMLGERPGPFVEPPNNEGPLFAATFDGKSQPKAVPNLGSILNQTK